jgi:cyanate permease
MGSGAIGGMFGPTLAGWVFDTFGNYLFAWFALLGIIILPIILVLRLDPKKTARI